MRDALPAAGDRALLIGVGNDWRGDDGAGLAVARRARELGVADVLEHDGEGTALLEAWSGRRHVVIVDAAASGAAPGTVHRFDCSSPLPAGLRRSSTHAFGVADAIELGRALGRLPERLEVYAIEGTAFGLEDGLTPAVAEAVEAVAQCVISRMRHAV